jgi:hypothetical protein
MFCWRKFARNNLDRTTFILMMKKTALSLLLLAALAACTSKKNIPDVSGVNVTVKLERFDQAFFQGDSNRPAESLAHLQQQFPGFYPDYMQGVLGVNGSPLDSTTLRATRLMLSQYRSLYDAIVPLYTKTDKLELEIRRGFQFVKYYFPDYKLPGLITFIGTLDAPGIALTNKYIAIGLQQYAGKNFPGYQQDAVKELYPAYISRRFEPAFIPVNCIKAVITDIFPDNSGTLPLAGQMIEKGKQWWLLDQLMPEAADSLKTGYTTAQLKWCNDNEGLIWSYILKNENLQSVDPPTIQTYIGEGPFTQGFSQELSPGNIGQWIGWRIVRKYADKHPEMKPADIMHADPKKILEESTYKPK